MERTCYVTTSECVLRAYENKVVGNCKSPVVKWSIRFELHEIH